MFSTFKQRQARPEDLGRVLELESTSYPEDEAATEDRLILRINQASEFFHVLEDPSNGKIIAFINGTCTKDLKIVEESMAHHDQDGKTLIIHSVVVDQSYRRNKIALDFLHHYIKHMHRENLVDRILLLSKSRLLPLYLKAGFAVVGLSDVEHGREKWFELSLIIRDHFALTQYQVDAFASKAFKGNPAAVVFVQREDAWMQALAMENNLAETSFLEKVDNTSNTYKLRWFTPAREVELCGHATLAAAHCIYNELREVPHSEEIHFQTVYSGILTAAYNRQTNCIELTFPATPVTTSTFSTTEHENLLQAFQLQPEEILYTGRSIYDTFVEISPEAFHRLREKQIAINYNLIASFGGRGLILTCRGVSNAVHLDTDFHFYSRCFFPLCGINEDPVTGSAHCTLAPYWFEKIGRDPTELVAYQDSDRGGVLRLRMTEEGTRVVLAGSALTTMKSLVHEEKNFEILKYYQRIH